MVLRAERKTAIITYQVITGNYNGLVILLRKLKIITYQVITGNYNEPQHDGGGN